MAEREHTHQPAQEQRPIDVDGAPDEEDLSTTDAADRVDLDPEEQVSRPDQSDFSEDEREQYDDPSRLPTAGGEQPPAD